MLTDPTPSPVRGNFVLLTADTLRLLLPQSDVGQASYLDEEPRDSGLDGLFEIGSPDAPRLAAALSPQLRPLPKFPGKRFVLTGLTAQDDIVLAWDEVKVLIDIELRPRPLPGPCLSPEAPLREYVEIGAGLAFCCSGERLLTYAFAGRS